MPLNSYLSLNMSAYENDEADTVIDVLDSNTTEDPLDTITKKEYYVAVEDAIDKSLSPFEKQVRGIEPPTSAWEADVLPLNYTCE